MTLQRNETIINYLNKKLYKDFKERMRAKERGKEQENSDYVASNLQNNNIYYWRYNTYDRIGRDDNIQRNFTKLKELTTCTNMIQTFSNYKLVTLHIKRYTLQTTLKSHTTRIN